jgi:hypothetical protein
VESPASQKKSKGKELSGGDKVLNRMLSGARVKVEHALAGIKRCRIIKDVFRLTKKGTSDVVMELACALHNLRVSNRHPLPTFDLLNFVSHA